MQANAILFMLLAVLIIWGGLVAATIALIMSNRRQARAEQEDAIARVLEEAEG